MKNINNYFWFCFGGKYDVGELHSVATIETIDFPFEEEVGYGAAIRKNQEVDNFGMYKEITANLYVSSSLILTIEFATALGTKSMKQELTEGNNTLTFVIPEYDGIKEIKFFVSHHDNRKLPLTEFKIIDWTLNWLF